MTLTKAVVTGAGQGMGRSIAMKLAKQGLSVVLIGKTSAKLEKVANEIQKISNRLLNVHREGFKDCLV